MRVAVIFLLVISLSVAFKIKKEDPAFLADEQDNPAPIKDQEDNKVITKFTIMGRCQYRLNCDEGPQILTANFNSLQRILSSP